MEGEGKGAMEGGGEEGHGHGQFAAAMAKDNNSCK